MRCANETRSVENTAASQAQKHEFPKMLYPTVHSPPLPSSISLTEEEQYAGCWEHGAYVVIKLSYGDDGRLNGTMESIIPADFYLEHFNADHFLWIPTSSFLPMTARAVFRVGGGMVRELGVQLERMDERGRKIWFVKM